MQRFDRLSAHDVQSSRTTTRRAFRVEPSFVATTRIRSEGSMSDTPASFLSSRTFVSSLSRYSQRSRRCSSPLLDSELAFSTVPRWKTITRCFSPARVTSPCRA